MFIYRRPELVKSLIGAIGVYQPSRLWIVADGPKEEQGSLESKLCVDARREAETGVNWPCEIKKIYADRNMGLKVRIESGLGRVFSEEREAILLEEDCHPSPDFFPFCEEMLQRYRDDKKVGGISGSCFLTRETIVESDYFFSRYLHIWGWGTWARAWNSYRPSEWIWPSQGFRSLFPSASLKEKKYWDRLHARVASGKIQTWDYPWLAHVWQNKMVSITPAENLVSNCGLGVGATNTKDENMETGIERTKRLLPPYRGPGEVESNHALDQEIFQNHFLKSEGRMKFYPRLARSIGRRLRYFADRNILRTV